MSDATRIPFITGLQLILVSIVLNRTKAFRFIVDTGAQRTIIAHDVADTLGLDIAHPLPFEAIVTAERQTPPAPVVRLDSAQVGGGNTTSRFGSAGIEQRYSPADAE
jgi:hypothetical protein